MQYAICEEYFINFCAQENQARLFTQAIQFDTVRNNSTGSSDSSAGLGLYSKYCFVYLHIQSLMLNMHIVSTKIVLSHDGKISVDSTGIAGNGSIFTLELEASSRVLINDPIDRFNQCLAIRPEESALLIEQPAVQAPAAAIVPTLTHANLNGNSRNIKKRFVRALVVDDSDLNRKMMINVLKRYFSDISEVINELEGIFCFS
jgi:hypothetical protein